jgi:PKD repeat protein
MIFMLWILPWATTFSAHAQDGCGTRDGAAMTPGRIAYEKYLQDYVQRSGKTAQEPKRYIIPTVVHVVHSGGPDSVRKEQVFSEFDNMRRFLRKLPGSYGFGGGEDAQIEFELATLDPNGQPTNGITYTRNNQLAYLEVDWVGQDYRDSVGSENAALKALIHWDRTKYCNIWLVREIRLMSGGSLAGYAHYPWRDSAHTDGIVVRARDFGMRSASNYAAYDWNFTGVHEAGHWLGLIHPFDSAGCAPGSCLTIGDKVCDLAPTEATFKVVNQRLNSCNQDPGWELPDNARNVMDYCSNAKAPNHLSAGQIVRCRATLENPAFPLRVGLWTDENHRATGVGKYGPVRADFSADERVPFAGNEVQFHDYSRNVPSRYLWRFPGGVPQTSTEPRPRVRYPHPGIYPVTLVVFRDDDQGNEIQRDSVVKPGYIKVIADSVTMDEFSEGFETLAAWTVYDPDTVRGDAGRTWTVQTQVGAFGLSDASALMDCFHYNDYFQRDALVSPAIVTRAHENLAFAFSYAYAPLDYEKTVGTPTVLRRLFTDTLHVDYSTDLGQTWTRAWSKGGTELGTADTVPTQNSPDEGRFVPKAHEWRRDTVRVPNAPYLRVRFTVVNGWGNALYLDDFKVLGDSIVEAPCDSCPCLDTCVSRGKTLPLHVLVYPNPAGETATLDFALAAAQTLSAELYDARGVRVYAFREFFPAGRHTRSIPTAILPEGVYLLRLAQTQRILVVRR